MKLARLGLIAALSACNQAELASLSAANSQARTDEIEVCFNDLKSTQWLPQDSCEIYEDQVLCFKDENGDLFNTDYPSDEVDQNIIDMHNEIAELVGMWVNQSFPNQTAQYRVQVSYFYHVDIGYAIRAFATDPLVSFSECLEEQE